ncbi:theronine dehydrogenase [Clostridium beijerinckii]|uniref:Theronine dehydrogenase n=1 Tax=Clostridium beijerinckii TaxID=1520 RepID=A0A0B5QJZ2_CLOBE|nr:zinc-binding dehydrogenase [Clostridium beijerinckii]AJG98222.1 theronine dehydrogenase [Clostridium beijerinckii]
MLENQIPQTAKISVLTGVKKMEVLELPIPEINDDEILVKVEGCGICGTDVHEYKGDPFNYIPVQLGHEGTGTIVKLGKNVKADYSGKTLNVGDKVVTGLKPCGACDTCVKHPERIHLCNGGEIFGLMPGEKNYFNGWFGEYMKINAGGVVFNVSDMDLDLRILIEPAAVIVHAVEKAKEIYNFKHDSNVLIQGCGPIGLLLLTLVRTMGVRNIIAVDGDEKRLELAKKVGASATVNFMEYSSPDGAIEAVKTLTNGQGADMAFQCTGSPKAASTIWNYIRRGGSLCELGFFVNNGDATYNPHLDICNKEIKVTGSWTYQACDWLQACEFLKEAQLRGLPVEELITHKFSLEEMNEAMETNIRMDGCKIAFVTNK